MVTVKKEDFVEIEYTGKIKEDGTVFDTTSAKIAKEKGSIAITCFESDHRYCHRDRIANKIISDKKNGHIVQHI